MGVSGPSSSECLQYTSESLPGSNFIPLKKSTAFYFGNCMCHELDSPHSSCRCDFCSQQGLWQHSRCFEMAALVLTFRRWLHDRKWPHTARSYGNSRICILNQSLNPLLSGRALRGSFYAGTTLWQSRGRLFPVVSVDFSLQHLGWREALPCNIFT